MRVAHTADPTSNIRGRLYEILAQPGETTPLQSQPAVVHTTDETANALPENFALHQAQATQDEYPGADINISDPVFDFVRSIRVFDISYARQSENRHGDCNRTLNMRLGTYGQQGDYSWQSTTPITLPPAHIGMEGYGRHCPEILHQSVFVEWQDQDGNYGFEQVNY